MRELEAGWFLVACIVLNIIFNVLVLVVVVLKQAIHRCKLNLIKKERRAALKLKKQKMLQKKEQMRQQKEDERNRTDLVYSLFHR